MKAFTFIHTSDLHLDLPIRGWKGSTEELLLRQREYRQTFERIIRLAKDRQVHFLLISGDFLEHQTIAWSTVKWIMDQFHQLPATRVFISPGKSDPWIKDSFYRTLDWPEHVHIFTDKWEELVFEEYSLRIIGKGKGENVSNVALPAWVTGPAEEERRMMITYGDVNEADLVPLELDYVALGQNHQRNVYQLDNTRNTVVCHPGSPEGISWKETGERTVTWGQFDSDGLTIEHLPIQTRRLERIEVDVTACKSIDEVLEKIVQSIPERKDREVCWCLKITGRRDPGLILHPDQVSQKLKERSFFHVEVQDQTTMGYNLDQLRSHGGLLGAYIRKMEKKIKEAAPEERMVLYRALEQGLDALLKEVKYL
ncbi:metallophosphoesterase family protein [Melghirimyces algeriensis]|uniref:DNA repair exonuclease SbcCD nuclease subunit n=1 Tax=Melghirimyces algeriensis TaxID=910412 RepID=A0A521CT28_9BACL|nr:metallophosphoesterase [Melghirimyces algeriensis]SMO62623.1 DNA repair exonuclease SbcCD nuclease subunit [Melghirimyces algeriensis]